MCCASPHSSGDLRGTSVRRIASNPPAPEQVPVREAVARQVDGDGAVSGGDRRGGCNHTDTDPTTERLLRRSAEGMVSRVLVLHCTRKLLLALGEPLTKDLPDLDPLDSWHANLFHWERRKCVMLVNDRTLFPVLLFGVKKPQLLDLPHAFTERFCSLLHERKVPAYIIDHVHRLYSETHLTTTSDRSVAGSLNQFIHELKWVVANRRLASPTSGTREVDEFLWAAASLQIPEFRVAEAFIERFLARFVEHGRPDLTEAKTMLRR